MQLKHRCAINANINNIAISKETVL